MKWTYFWRFLLLFSFTGQLLSTVSVEAQQDRPLLNLLGNILENAINSANNPPPPPPTQYPMVLSPDMAYQQLVAGNARFTRNDTQAADTLPPLPPAGNRPPIATVIFSPEMRTTPDYLLDIDPDYLYQIPTRASVFTSEELDDLEFGIVNLRTPVVVVLTHAPCREIANLLSVWSMLSARAKRQVTTAGTFFSGTNNRPTSDNELLYSLVGPAVARTMAAYPDISITQATQIIAEAVAWQSIETMLMQSTALRQLLTAGVVDLVAGVVDERSGEVQWLGRHPMTAEFLKTIPQDFMNRYSSGNVTKAMLPPPLSSRAVERYLSDQKTSQYYSAITNLYYYRPSQNVPSWELFRSEVWSYRPWFGVWVPDFYPLPKYNPWYYEPIKSYQYWTPGHPEFFIQFNWGVENHHIAPDYRPHDPRWDKPIYRDPRQAPDWEKGSPWDNIWNRGPMPAWQPPPPRPYVGPVGGPGPVISGWKPGDAHPGNDHPQGNPYHNDPGWNDGPGRGPQQTGPGPQVRPPVSTRPPVPARRGDVTDPWDGNQGGQNAPGGNDVWGAIRRTGGGPARMDNDKDDSKPIPEQGEHDIWGAIHHGMNLPPKPEQATPENRRPVTGSGPQERPAPQDPFLNRPTGPVQQPHVMRFGGVRPPEKETQTEDKSDDNKSKPPTPPRLPGGSRGLRR